MEEDDLRQQILKSLPPEVYAKCHGNFHMKGGDIAIRYDSLVLQLSINSLYT